MKDYKGNIRFDCVKCGKKRTHKIIHAHNGKTYLKCRCGFLFQTFKSFVKDGFDNKIIKSKVKG